MTNFTFSSFSTSATQSVQFATQSAGKFVSSHAQSVTTATREYIANFDGDAAKLKAKERVAIGLVIAGLALEIGILCVLMTALFVMKVARFTKPYAITAYNWLTLQCIKTLRYWAKDAVAMAKLQGLYDRMEGETGSVWQEIVYQWTLAVCAYRFLVSAESATDEKEVVAN